MRETQKPTLCFLVLGTSLSVLLQNLEKRRTVAIVRPATRRGSAEIIDLAAWRELKSREPLLM